MTLGHVFDQIVALLQSGYRHPMGSDGVQSVDARPGTAGRTLYGAGQATKRRAGYNSTLKAQRVAYVRSRPCRNPGGRK